ncbi:MAG: hypothetical protein ABI593_02465 [Betaproteobacteria bacterium]
MEAAIVTMGADSRIAPTGERGMVAVAWGAIVGGAIAAAALSLILLTLGSGLGLSAISPWAYQGASATTLGVGAIAWLIVMSAAASALGGYIAGRLRVRWMGADADESYFRDSVHGFLAWALATIVSAALLTSAASSMVGTVATTGAMAAGGAAAIGSGGAAATSGSGPTDNGGMYFVDMLYRTDRAPEPGVDTNAIRTETARILANSLRQGELSAGDRSYLAQLVARRTGITPADAEQRVSQTVEAAKLTAEASTAKARQIAEAARKATAYMALWVFLSLLIGAFCASYAATIGGRQRDSLD